MGRKSKVIKKMGLPLKKQPWEGVVFSAASFPFYFEAVHQTSKRGQDLMVSIILLVPHLKWEELPQLRLPLHRAGPSCHLPLHLDYLPPLHLAHTPHHMPEILFVLLVSPLLLPPNCHCLRLSFQTRITVQTASETQLGRVMRGKVWNSFASCFLLWVFSWLLTHKTNCGYRSNLKCQGVELMKNVTLIDGEFPLEVPCKYQVNESILGK